ncbi:VOC family protein [Consotaella salsifontis]|uniref:VOC domain-containing protein n=1 Tax=Consotaella salsifontis TaxID=1365950 RepID=A0A1T4N1X8_9HYPH|nr:VOC family protein [Consotaella salsifontis]SJZ73212.1 hypothetical protein SAMN05428963_102383 [Consotaella salsifontis]
MIRNGFSWYELATSNAAASQSFYGDVVGWTFQGGDVGGRPYQWLVAGGGPIGGMMEIAADISTGWTGLVQVDDVDATVEAALGAGARLLHEAETIPGMVRFAILQDPTGAAFGVFALTDDSIVPPAASIATTGTVCWRELHTFDPDAAFLFYSKLFGWQKDQAFDMGEMGTYQTFTVGGQAAGGIMRAPPYFRQSSWLFYFVVDAVEAGMARIEQAGGRVVWGPSEVPGGRIAQALDLEGTMFGIFSMA